MRLSILCFAMVVAAVPALAEEPEDPRVQEIRRRIEALTERHAKDIIEEQQDRRERADAALAVGAFLELGMMGDPKPLRAFEYYRLASQLGSAEADCALGNLYSNGVEAGAGRLDRDPAQAITYYRRAAEGGSVKAMVRLGEIFSDGIGVPADSKAALGHFMDAAKRGDADAIKRLEPVMRQAREWEAARPGRKSNFPTSREGLIDPALVKADRNRTEQLNRFASHIYVELNRRVGASGKENSK